MIQVDHSIIESFAQGGRTVITSRVYPTEAIYGAARLFLFNNATDINIKASLRIWQLNSAFIRPFPFDQKLWKSKLWMHICIIYFVNGYYYCPSQLRKQWKSCGINMHKGIKLISLISLSYPTACRHTHAMDIHIIWNLSRVIKVYH